MSMTVLLALVAPLVGADEPKHAAPLEKAWYSPVELMTQLGKRDGLRWAMPESLAGRAFVGGDMQTKALLDNACEQWGLNWIELNRVIVIHKAQPDELKRQTDFLSAGGETAPVAAWKLGWLRDARAIPPLAEALLSKEPAIALAAARAINILVREIPIGRDERVDALPAGRVSLATAFSLPLNLATKLDSPYPAIRAAVMRLFFAHEGKYAEAAKARSEKDPSILVQQVRQQALFAPSQEKKAKLTKWDVLLPLPKNAAQVKAACTRMIGELPGLEKQSAWEEMQHRVRIMAAWSKGGSEPAADALIELTTTKIQSSWFPGFVQMELAATGSDKVTAKLKELIRIENRAALLRGLEQSHFELLSFTAAHIAEQSNCYVTARRDGQEALALLMPLARRNNIAAVDALGVIGGSNAASVVANLGQFGPLSATLEFRAAKALGNIGSPQAAEELLDATNTKNRLHRHAATLFLGRIGGPKVEARLIEILENDPERLVRAAAADALEQIGGEKNLAAVAKFRKADTPVPVATYQPRNPRFGADFPVNEWVNLKIRIEAFAEFGEMGWNYDAANKLFFRYGGCSGYTNELTVFDLGTEQFTQRRPNEEMVGWEDRRPPRGCSGGRTWDPYRKVAWIGPSIGGTASDLAIAEYYNKDGGYRFCSYDLATDRFRPAPFHQASYGEATNRFAFDWKNGLLYPVKFQHANHKTKDWWAFDTRSIDPYVAEAWLNKTNPPGDYPRHTGYTTATVDQDTGLLVVYVPAFDSRPPETWTYEPIKNLWKNTEPREQPRGQAGAGLAYDPFHKLIVLQSGKKVTQYGGPEDSITWTYDVRTNTWTDLKPTGGPGNPWVGAMDFDPEHNVFVVFNHRDRSVWAYRLKAVPVGMRER